MRVPATSSFIGPVEVHQADGRQGNRQGDRQEGPRGHRSGERRARRDRRPRPVKAARIIGYPVIIKAVAGGGGRRHADRPQRFSFAKEFHVARNEAEKAFGDGRVYLEKYIERPRHIGSRSWRTPRQGDPPRRKGLLRPEAPPEADRGGALAVPDPGPAQEDGQRRRSARPRRPSMRTPGRSSSSWMPRANFYLSR